MKALMPILLALALGACTRPETKTEAAAVSAVKAPDPHPGRITIPADSPKLKQIRVEEVALASVPAGEVEAPGRIEVNPNRVSHIVAPVAGRVVAVNVRLGDAVSQGQPVLTMESPDADAAISSYLQAEAQLGQMKSAAIKAQADLDRVRDLLEHQAVAQKEVLNAELALAQAKASVEQSEALKQQALRRLEIFGLKPGQFGQRIVLPAPVSGKVLELTVVPGEFRNDTNQALATIADLSTVWVVSDVPESAIRFIQVGEPITLELSAYPGETFHGRVARLADTVDPATRTVKVRAELDNSSGRLRPEMFGRIRHTEPGRPTPVAPASALVQSEKRSYVYREISPGVFQQTPVTAGDRAGDKIAILDGLSPGDRVVVDGVMLLKSN